MSTDPNTNADRTVAEAPYRSGTQRLTFAPEDMGVAVVIPGKDAMIFRGQESDLIPLAELTSRDREIAKTLLRDAINRLDGIGQKPYPVGVPIQQPYPSQW